MKQSEELWNTEADESMEECGVQMIMEYKLNIGMIREGCRMQGVFRYDFKTHIEITTNLSSIFLSQL